MQQRKAPNQSMRRCGLLHQVDHLPLLRAQVLNNIFEGKTALLNWVTGMTSLTHVDIQRVDISAGELQRFAALPELLHLGVGDLTLEADSTTSDLVSNKGLAYANKTRETYIKGDPGAETFELQRQG